LLHLFSYLRPWRRSFMVAMGALLISMCFGLMFPFLVGHLLDAAIPSIKHVATPAWMRDIDTIALVLLGTLTLQAALTFFFLLHFQQGRGTRRGAIAAAALRTPRLNADAILW
jgi:ATP-binding cassette subfamily B protein